MQAGAEYAVQGRGGYGAVAAGLALLLAGAGLTMHATGGPPAWWIAVGFAAGVACLALEAFVIPGFGPAGVAGIVLTLLATIAALIPDGRGGAWLATGLPGGLTLGHLAAGGGVLAAVAGAGLLMVHAPRLPVLSKLTLITPDGAALALPHPHPHIALPGDVGEVIGDLRPGGRARFGAEVVDVRSRGEYVSAGTRVEVLKREGAAIIVRPLPDSQGQTETT